MKKYYVVRNLSGQCVATYFARSSKEAIAKLLRDQNTYGATFRRSRLKAMTINDFTAKVESTD